MIASPPFYCLVVAAGLGARVGGDIPKQYQRLGGKMLLRHTLDALLTCPGLREMRVAVQPEHLSLYENAVQGLCLPPPVWGGIETRQQSVFNGIKAFSHLKYEDIFLIHDAARPFISIKDIDALLHALDHNEAATLVAPITSSLRGADGHVSREGMMTVTTPQGFHYGLLARAHAAAEPGFNDDACLVEAAGISVALVPGSTQNIKLTTKDDMDMAAKILSTPCVAMGFDVHGFNAAGSGPLRLCGVDIAYERGLIGHSDADVVLHAITDALLGLTANGDIGTHFPPHDIIWKNADSRLFVEKALEILIKNNGFLTHIDITIICEMPKITPYREAMQEAVARITHLPKTCISIKATTTEGLGFTGRGQGIAAQAVATALF